MLATQLWSCEKADEKSETPTDQTISPVPREVRSLIPDILSG